MGFAYKNPTHEGAAPDGAGLTSLLSALSPEFMAGAAAPVPGEFLIFRQAAKSNPSPQVPALLFDLCFDQHCPGCKVQLDFPGSAHPQCPTHPEHPARTAESLLPTSAAKKTLLRLSVSFAAAAVKNELKNHIALLKKKNPKPKKPF